MVSDAKLMPRCNRRGEVEIPSAWAILAAAALKPTNSLRHEAARELALLVQQASERNPTT